MDKQKAVATLGQNSLLLSAWITAALLANDRLKLYLSVLQSAAVIQAGKSNEFWPSVATAFCLSMVQILAVARSLPWVCVRLVKRWHCTAARAGAGAMDQAMWCKPASM